MLMIARLLSVYPSLSMCQVWKAEANSNRACYNPKRQNMKPRTPFLLYLLAIFFVLVTLIHLFGVIQTVQSWNWLRAIDYQPGPIYTVFKNIFLFLAFLFAAIFLLLRFGWAPLFDGIVVVLNAAWFWIDRLVLTQNPLPFKGHLFNLAATAAHPVFLPVFLVPVAALHAQCSNQHHSTILLEEKMNKAPLEKEVKFYLSDLSSYENRLRSLGAVLLQPRTRELNYRFDTADLSLTHSQRVLRLRQDQKNILTYKGPSDTSEGVRVRPEIELEVDDFEKAVEFLKALGYSLVVQYEKWRTTYTLHGLEITLDEMPYGNFSEIEGEDTCRHPQYFCRPRTGLGMPRQRQLPVPF